MTSQAKPQLCNPSVGVLLLFAALCLFPQSASADKELAKLQGVWKGVEGGDEGQEKIVVTIDGEKIDFQGAHEQEWYRGKIELSKNKKHKIIYGTIQDCPVKELIGKIANAIYRLEDDRITIASRPPGDPEMPSGFDDEKCRVIELKRRDRRGNEGPRF